VRPGLKLSIKESKFYSAETDDAQKITNVLSELNAGNSKISPLFPSRPPASPSYQNRKQRPGERQTDSRDYFVIDLPEGADAALIASKLNELNGVEYAEPRRRPAPPPGVPTPNFESSQTYKGDAPNGIGILGLRRIRGSDGAGLRAIDLEYSWRLNHEDLNVPRTRRHAITGCRIKDPFNSQEHGTAVLGVIAGERNAYGVTGISPGARIDLIPVNCEPPHDYSLDKAIELASTMLRPGEVIIIEQQTEVCGSNQYGPAEDEQSVFDAIERATKDRNIIVVEAAGNGNVDLDSAACGGIFNRNVRDSGAIIVGAGSATDRSRKDFSSYGDRVDVQGWGEQVTTTGYGDILFDTTSSLNPRRYYTRTFNGTSSATPIVASAVLAINGVRKACNLSPASPTEMRTILASTGSQQTNVGSGHIGPLPNIRAALAAMPEIRKCVPQLRRTVETANR
jgi:serine protease